MDRPFANDHERSEWLVAQRLAAGANHVQSRLIASYEAVRERARQRGDRAEPVERGTHFEVTGRKMHPDER